MDSNSRDYDTYRGTEAAQNTPDLGKKGGGKTAGSAAKEDGRAKEAAAAEGDFGQGDQGINGAKQKEQLPGGWKSSVGKKLLSKKGGGKSKIGGKVTASGFVIICLVMLAVVGTVVTSPLFIIGMLDYNLQKTLGFSPTVAILEKATGYFLGEKLSKGEVPVDYARDLAKSGIQVGQVTVAGDFVPTNKYIANVEELNKIAAIGSGFQLTDADGELAVLFGDELIRADDFVAAVESDPKLYAAFSEATDISARYYYSKEANEVFDETGASRNSFYDFKSTGDAEIDQENYNKMLESALDIESEVSVNGFGEDSELNVSMEGNGSDVVEEVADGTTGADTTDSTARGAQIMNAAVSADESYKAAAAFVALEEVTNRVRLDGSGPMNETMNMLYTPTITTYVDVSSGEEVQKETAIIDTPNFAAAASEGTFSKTEAMSFARDRVLISTGSADEEIIKESGISTDGQKKSDTIISMLGLSKADKGILDKAADNIDVALAKNSAVYQGIIGGNRIVEGGSFVSDTINMRLVAALPSDAETVLAYNHEASDALARKEAAERATLSPFDISSPNTFLGSIAYSFAAGLIRNRSTLGGGSALSTLGSVASATSDSLNGLLGGAIADGEDSNYLTTFGDYCKTPEGVSSSADIFCTQTGTITTKFLKRKEEDWNIDKDEYEEFVLLAMGRKPTVGLKNTAACEALAEKNALEFVADLFGAYSVCDDIDEDDKGKVNGADYVLSDNNSKRAKMEEYAGYALYDEVSSLLEGKESTAYQIRKEYYAKHPVDNSAAGVLASRSGLSKAEAQVALNYYSYLDMIANYHPETRFSFGEPQVMIEKNILVEHSDSIALNYYAVKHGEIEYDSIRSRSFAA